MFTSLYEKVSAACCYITVFLGNEKISDGTGFAHTEAGEVLTAAHVVTGRWPIRHEDYRDPSQRIFCKFPGRELAEYKVSFCSLGMEVPAFTEIIQVDLAVLLPIARKTQAPFISSSTEAPSLGERIFMAGFSEEVRLPFDVDRLLPAEFHGVGAFRSAMERGYMADLTGPMIKQGFVGNIRRVVAMNTASDERIDCDLMYIDNAMHSGASGGPVFNEHGVAVGVVSQRAVTRVDRTGADRLDVPAGSTLAVGLAPLIYVAAKSSRT